MIFSCIWGLFILGSGIKTITLIILIFYSLLGIKQALQSLLISLMIYLCNNALFGVDSSIVATLRIILLFVASASIGLRLILRKNNNSIHKVLFITILFLLLTSFISSYNLTISVFKLFIFAIGSIAIIAGFTNCRTDQKKWLSVFVSFVISIIIFSIPTLFFPSIGFARNGSGFQGIINHPQALGVILSPFVALLTGKVFFENKRNLVDIIFLFAGLTLLLLTQARTGLIAILLSLIVIILASFYDSKRFSTLIRPLKDVKVGLVSIFILLAIALNWNTVASSARDFVFKRNQGKNLSEAFESSRGFLILMQLENIRNNPVSGIGFQLPSTPKMLTVKNDPFFNLPIQASIEKGNIFTSSIEENGVIGSIAVAFFIIFLFSRVIQFNTIPVAWFSLTGFFTNIGESALFSFGGLGLYVWLIIGVSIAGFRYRYKN